MTNSKISRSIEIDFLRAIAIVLMSLTHIHSIYLSTQSTLFNIFSTLGSTLCFSIFLFCSSYTAGLKIEQGKKDTWAKVFKRVAKIYGVYLLLGILVEFVLSQTLSLSQILRIATIQHVPEFTEFLIAFILFALLTQLLFKPLQYLQKRPLIFILIAICLFLLSRLLHTYLSSISLNIPLRIVVENITGYQTLHRFPVLPYFIIFSLGILLSKENNTSLLKQTFLISVLVIILSRVFDISEWYRWPPSVLFIMYGIAFITFVLLLFKRYPVKNSHLFTFSNIGKFPLDQFFLSTFLIFAPVLVIGREKDILTTLLISIPIFITHAAYPIVRLRKMV